MQGIGIHFFDRDELDLAQMQARQRAVPDHIEQHPFFDAFPRARSRPCG